MTNKSAQSSEPVCARRALHALRIMLILTQSLYFSITTTAHAAQRNQDKQCAATPAQALAQIRAQRDAHESELINPNTASLSELMSLPGVGQTKARAIIAYRQQQGAFSTIDEITQVSGIGEITYAKFKDRLTLAP